MHYGKVIHFPLSNSSFSQVPIHSPYVFLECYTICDRVLWRRFQQISYIEDISWARGDTKFLFVLKNISRVSAANEWNIFSTRKVKFRISLIYHINTNEIPNHFSLIVFWCERRDLLCIHSSGDIFTCEDNMLFLHVKISSFRAKAHLVFHWCLYNNPFYTLLWSWTLMV